MLHSLRAHICGLLRESSRSKKGIAKRKLLREPPSKELSAKLSAELLVELLVEFLVRLVELPTELPPEPQVGLQKFLSNLGDDGLPFSALRRMKMFALIVDFFASKL